MVDAVLALPADTRLMLLAPVVRDRKGEFADLRRPPSPGLCALPGRWRHGGSAGHPAAQEDREARHRRRDRPRQAAARHAGEPAPALGRELRGGAAAGGRSGPGAAHGQEETLLFSSKFACPVCSYSLPELEPRLFSFNSPVGPARPAKVWARSRCSTPSGWSPSPRSRSPAAPSRAGTAATPTPIR